MKTLLYAAVLALGMPVAAQTRSFTRDQYKEDFNFFWKSIDEDYCYFFKKQTDWNKVKAIYAPALDTITTRDQFVTLLENALGEIYDHHASLNTNTDLSERLVPSGTDMWAEYVHDRPVILQVRPGYGAARAGMVAGMQVSAINDVPVQQAIARFIPRSLKKMDTAAMSYALRMALAGDHVTPRKITVKTGSVAKDFYPDANGMMLEHIHYNTLLNASISNGIGIIRINNCLYDDELIRAFDSAMALMKNTQGLILDLRETPSGGNTSVARAILGWFITKEGFYQKHELYAEEKQTGIKRSWEEIVSPRTGKYYSKPLVILADHWTGSVSEGITIGFDALKKGTIIGTELPRLCGAVYTYTLPQTGIHFSFPVERLYHVNGMPRENFEPAINIDYTGVPGTRDLAVEKAMQILRGRQHTGKG